MEKENKPYKEEKSYKNKKCVTESFAWEDTFSLGEKLGANATSGTVVCINGDLGVGKTVFTQGFAKGLGISEPISSPTYTIVQEYHTGRIPFYHFDVYRIGDASEMEDIGYEDYFFGNGVCLIEWACLIEDIIPKDAISVTIEKKLEKGFDYRLITIIK